MMPLLQWHKPASLYITSTLKSNRGKSVPRGLLHPSLRLRCPQVVVQVDFVEATRTLGPLQALQVLSGAMHDGRVHGQPRPVAQALDSHHRGLRRTLCKGRSWEGRRSYSLIQGSGLHACLPCPLMAAMPICTTGLRICWPQMTVCIFLVFLPMPLTNLSTLGRLDLRCASKQGGTCLVIFLVLNT